MVERTMSLGFGANGGTSGVRETMWAQQELLQKISQELDDEREASSSAASEALSMILRLQGEKAALEMETSQYKRMAEEKMCHAETSLTLFEDLIYNKEMEIASLSALGSLIQLSWRTSSRKISSSLSPFDGMSSERRSLLLSDTNGDSSLSPGEDLSAYWEEMRRIDEHVREISDSRDAPKESKWPLLRRKSMSHALVSQVSNTILKSAKSDVSSIMERMKKNPDRLSPAKDALSPNLQDIFKIPRTKESLTIISEEEELEERNKESQVRGNMESSNYERELSKPPPSIKEEHMSLLKEIREQLNAMQSKMRSLRSELHQTQHVSHLEEDPALNSIQEAMIHFWL
ncbi:hypothetical protein IGI04_005409 [Brassica rapa subsp. trilocularis]|uniref:GTD-binding domain-containing protein n=1 Tax=Brassica rapa subsp. trilocularis TaxID=1813537 RepID=A0ABQ7NGA7_BRACM|nr:hypothetical protein IGI04_005409 [Brassica rapa subsp. trilocularis]